MINGHYCEFRLNGSFPWHKLDVLKSLYFPSLQYALRTNQITKMDWSKLNDNIRKVIKKYILCVHCRADNEYLYESTLDHYLETNS